MKIAFDIGNVLCHVDFEHFFKILQRQIPVNDKEFNSFFNIHEHLNFIGLSSLKQSLKQQFPSLPDEYGMYDYLLQIWNQCVWPNNQMLNFMQILKHEGIKIALLSNIGKEHADYLKQACPELFEVFAEHLSYEVGTFKPQKLFFQSFLLEYPEFSGCLYLDDRKENVIMGSRMGFNAIQFDLNELTKDQSPTILKKKLDEIRRKIR